MNGVGRMEGPWMTCVGPEGFSAFSFKSRLTRGLVGELWLRVARRTYPLGTEPEVRDYVKQFHCRKAHFKKHKNENYRNQNDCMRMLYLNLMHFDAK